MSANADPTPETVLRWCAAADPGPWYPGEHARAAGVARAGLDAPAEALRMAGYLDLTEWVPGKGQGYALTPAGRDALRKPSRLAKLGVAPAAEPEPAEDRRSGRRPVTAWERGEIVRDALLRRGGVWMTWVLLAFNLAVFALGLALARRHNIPAAAVLDGKGVPVAHWLGALRGADLEAGEWWRLLTCCFVHHGALHLGMNMLSLGLVGPLVERLWGSWRFLALYLVAGFCGSVAGIYQEPDITLAGASGALWGLLVSFLAWLVLNRNHLPVDLLVHWGTSVVVVLVINTAQSFQPHISWQGHFGGGAAGAAAAVLLNLERFGSHAARWAALVLLAALPAGSVALLAGHIERDLRWREAVEGPRLYRMLDGPVRAALAAGRRVNAPEFRRLLTLPPADRPAAEVRADAEAFDAAREELDRGLERLRPAEFRTPGMDEAREAAVRFLEARGRRLGALADKLRAGGDWTDDREDELERLTRADRQAAEEARPLLERPR